MTQEYLGTPRGLIPGRATLKVAASAVINRGAAVCFNSGRYAIEGTTVAGGAVQYAGTAIDKVDNTGGADGDLLVEVSLETYEFINSTLDPIDLTSVGKVVYLESYNTVAKTSAGGALVEAGLMTEISDAATPKISVFGNFWVSDLARATREADTAAAGGLLARNVVTANVATPTAASAYTVASNAAVNDAVLNVAGDVILLVGQTTASQNGLYVVGTVATGTAALTRHPAMPTGATVKAGTSVSIGNEGTFYGNATFKAMGTTTGGMVIGTNDPVFYPREIKKTITLSGGTYTIGAGGGAEPLMLFSTTKSSVTALRNTAGTSTATTGGYASPVASRIAGIAGTAAVLVQAQVAAGTISNADVSTLDVLIVN